MAPTNRNSGKPAKTKTRFRVPRPQAVKGSQKWLQIAVNHRPELVNQEIRLALGMQASSTIEWRSPLETDDYAEYRDSGFLERLGVRPERQPLGGFWPRRGPVWDGLARTDRGDLILVEAKAHVGELLSTPSRASPTSLRKIRRSLKEVHTYCGSSGYGDWTSAFYQYTNRIAHLYFLRVKNSLPAHLLFLYFLNAEEMHGPTSRDHWEGCVELLHAFLGLRHHRLTPYIHHIFLDTRPLAKPQ